MLHRDALPPNHDDNLCRIEQDQWFDRLPLLAEQFLAEHHRPLVTVSYAQSVDGSIATRNREQLRLSGDQSMILTHRIRAACDARWACGGYLSLFLGVCAWTLQLPWCAG